MKSREKYKLRRMIVQVSIHPTYIRPRFAVCESSLGGVCPHKQGSSVWYWRNYLASGYNSRGYDGGGKATDPWGHQESAGGHQGTEQWEPS